MCYVLITAARNEESYIEGTIKSVIGQTERPKRWVIVSDSSEDLTDVIVSEYASYYPFISLVRREKGVNRNFASKVEAIKLGFEKLADDDYEFYGNLDADITIEPHYYEYVLKKFKENPRLGIAGGVLLDFYNGFYHKHNAPSNSVGGPIQMFRRECYEQIGGFIPLEMGNEDGVAEVMGRMHGWEVESFPELRVLHHRETGTEGRNVWAVRYREGKLEYLIGYHPLFHLARMVQRLFYRPYIFGSVLRTFSFFLMYIKRPKRPVPEEYIKYLRWEERKKLIALFSFRSINS